MPTRTTPAQPVTARLSLFDKRGFLPVENPPEFIRTCRKRFGRACITSNKAFRFYKWITGFDYITVRVAL